VTCYDDGSLRIDLDKRQVSIAGKTVNLRPRDYDVLRVLVTHRGQPLSPEQLADLAWEDRTWVARDRMKYSVARLKCELGWTDSDGPIEKVRGVGFRYRTTSE
jgi:DNA-binding response OmpR family regulator